MVTQFMCKLAKNQILQDDLSRRKYSSRVHNSLNNYCRSDRCFAIINYKIKNMIICKILGLFDSQTFDV